MVVVVYLYYCGCTVVVNSLLCRLRCCGNCTVVVIALLWFYFGLCTVVVIAPLWLLHWCGCTLYLLLWLHNYGNFTIMVITLLWWLHCCDDCTVVVIARLLFYFGICTVVVILLWWLRSDSCKQVKQCLNITFFPSEKPRLSLQLSAC